MQTLTYDNASRITKLTETGLSAKTYGYDNDDRLTGFVNGTATTSYGYDADSNRSSTITPAPAPRPTIIPRPATGLPRSAASPRRPKPTTPPATRSGTAPLPTAMTHAAA